MKRARGWLGTSVPTRASQDRVHPRAQDVDRQLAALAWDTKIRAGARIQIDPALVLQLPDSLDPNSSFESGYRYTEELLEQKKKFTALMAFDDLTALGAIRALIKAGVKVPEQCSVTGFDDVALSALAAPSLTTVRQPMEAMGELAVNIIMEGINAALEKREWNVVNQKMNPELVIRDSTRAVSLTGADD
jgi:LacI family transcriptional regulator